MEERGREWKGDDDDKPIHIIVLCVTFHHSG